MVREEKKKNTGMHGYDYCVLLDFCASGAQDTYLSASLVIGNEHGDPSSKPG